VFWPFILFHFVIGWQYQVNCTRRITSQPLREIKKVDRMAMRTLTAIDAITIIERMYALSYFLTTGRTSASEISFIHKESCPRSIAQ
jgi:hypothetical protein